MEWTLLPALFTTVWLWDFLLSAICERGSWGNCTLNSVSPHTEIRLQMTKNFGQFSARQAGTSSAGQATVPTTKKTKTQVLNGLQPCRWAVCTEHGFARKGNIVLVVWLLFAQGIFYFSSPPGRVVTGPAAKVFCGERNMWSWGPREEIQLEDPSRGKAAAGHLSKHSAQMASLEKPVQGIQGMAVHKEVSSGLPTLACLVKGCSLCTSLGLWAGTFQVACGSLFPIMGEAAGCIEVHGAWFHCWIGWHGSENCWLGSMVSSIAGSGSVVPSIAGWCAAQHSHLYLVYLECVCQGCKEVMWTRVKWSCRADWPEGEETRSLDAGQHTLTMGCRSGKSWGDLVGLGTHRWDRAGVTDPKTRWQEPCHSRAHRSPSETAKQMCRGLVQGSWGGAAVGNSPDDSQESWMQEPQQQRLLC